MSRFWTDKIASLDPYVPGEQPQDKQYIKLNTNESPYGPSPKALAAMQDQVSEKLRLYPDPNCQTLKNALAKTYSVDADHVFVGNGSDEVLALAFMGYFAGGKPLAFADITYSFYKVYANLYGITPDIVPLNDDFDVVPSDYENLDVSGIVITNPNAPTGKALPLADIEKVLQSNPDIVVLVDEAYVDFGAQSAVTLVGQYPNLMVVQTLSKSRALAGIRVGYAIAQPELIEGLERLKNSFNSYPVDRIALAGATAAVEDTDYLEEICQKTVATREWTTIELEALGFQVLPSATNFVFVTHPEHEAESLYLGLKEQGILVRYFGNKPRIGDFLRITIGTDAEMAALVARLKEM
ncbi:Histidinol-phosphate aminotransferase [Marinomonas gallaica]|uniref:Histidinol-phosphate aminotransferase n=1 Tax=Marinomonas gallaica TaxID=1806667 RepID=A0A1C3JNB0_9GAMM|nr:MULTISPECIES: histidinol-phosphate transaminase [Marinomonas]SBT16537.1 Histidinol-phosphate aminotransferase [Marinomonas gallaica]SBT20253.1 Histidinol-phosphate aminotransferase [Marinomonas gallaica]